MSLEQALEVHGGFRNCWDSEGSKAEEYLSSKNPCSSGFVLTL